MLFYEVDLGKVGVAGAYVEAPWEDMLWSPGS